LEAGARGGLSAALIGCSGLEGEPGHERTLLTFFVRKETPIMVVRRLRKAFTLVEILIVVVILGILAAIVVPQFTNASSEAQVSNVESQLQTIRNQIELFRAQHNGAYPDFTANQWADLVSNDYLRSEPYNPRTNSATIAAAEGPTVGWVWDAANLKMSAAYFNEMWRYDPANPNPWTGP
jgi:general secretion pathway protein G